jgi:hypothetical protein
MKHEVPSNYREILQEIGWFFYRTGDGIVPEGRLLEALHETFGDQAPNRVPIDRNILVAHMLQPVEAGAPGLLNPIEFTHQSFREYLVAERIWRLLGPVRLGEGPVAPSTWLYLCHKPLSTSEIEFLADLASELPWDEASALYLGLADTDNVHQYWTKWASPSWERLRAKLDLASVESARESANVAASRACNLATLGFLLRVKCFARLRTLAREEETELPKAPGAELLSRLLHLLLAFPETGVGGDNRALLLQNLQGLALEPRSLLDNLRLEAPCLRNALLRQVTFSGSHWSDADVQGADLTGARFEACRLHFANTGHAVFRDAVLTDAILTHPEGRPIRDADFSGADLGRARLIDVQMIDCRFARNRWLGAAHFRSSARSTAVLRGCELDDDAERFFSSQGFVLEQCRRI